jgi:hypothetical protein
VETMSLFRLWQCIRSTTRFRLTSSQRNFSWHVSSQYLYHLVQRANEGWILPMFWFFSPS